MSGSTPSSTPGVADVDGVAQRRRRRRRVIGILVLVALGLVVYVRDPWGLATRMPGVTPDASGAALTGPHGAIAINQTAAVTGLAPGSPAQELYGTFTVPGDETVRVGAVTATVEGTDRKGCGAKDFVITGSPTRVEADVSPGEGRGAWSGIWIRLDNRSVNQDACKGARAAIVYRVD